MITEPTKSRHHPYSKQIKLAYTVHVRNKTAKENTQYESNHTRKFYKHTLSIKPHKRAFLPPVYICIICHS